MQQSVATTAQSETQVTTIVQQLDAQGPQVVQRISTQFADVTCSEENARKLVEALHGGTAVTLTADGKTATFTPTSKLGYGEAYIALALAAEALRNAGVTNCATPDQWKAALMGGPLAASGTTTTSTTQSASSSSSSNFPGVLALRAQGQGWGQIAKTTNVQLGQVVSRAQSSFSSSMQSGDSTLSPTGKTSAEMNAGADAASASDKRRGKSEGAPYGKAYGHDKNDGKGKGKDKTDRSDDDEPSGADKDSDNPDNPNNP